MNVHYTVTLKIFKKIFAWVLFIFILICMNGRYGIYYMWGSLYSNPKNFKKIFEGLWGVLFFASA